MITQTLTKLGHMTGESCTRFRFAGSITRMGNCILINYDAIDKQDRQEDLDTAKHFIRYAMTRNIKLHPVDYARAVFNRDFMYWILKLYACYRCN